jgi:hypothetical protein
MYICDSGEGCVQKGRDTQKHWQEEGAMGFS